MVITCAGLLDSVEGCFEFCFGCVLALIAEKERRIVCLAGVASAKRVGLIVNQCEPGGVKVKVGVAAGHICLGWQADCEPDQGWPNAKHVAHGFCCIRG
jgi:hypothetical protein